MLFRGGVMENAKWPAELDALFASYRTAVSEPEPSADFLPGMWAKIEQRRGIPYSFRRWASGFVTVAVAICLMLSAAQSITSTAPVSGGATYVEVLADTEMESSLDQ